MTGPSPPEPRVDDASCDDGKIVPIREPHDTCSGSDGDGVGHARRMRDAIAVAVALLDELLGPAPAPPGDGDIQDIADVFEEIRDLASEAARLLPRARGEGTS